MSARLLAVALLAFGLGACDVDGVSKGLKAKVGVGDAAPPSNNLTVDNPDEWYLVSSMDTKVPLYRWKIAELLEQRKPFIVVFGTPQHCTMCVDQIVRIAVMEEKFGDRFAFLHVDGYRDSAIWQEWGVTGEPWTFVVDGSGIVRNVFPGQTELALLEHEINAILEDS